MRSIVKSSADLARLPRIFAVFIGIIFLFAYAVCAQARDWARVLDTPMNNIEEKIALKIRYVVGNTFVNASNGMPLKIDRTNPIRSLRILQGGILALNLNVDIGGTATVSQLQRLGGTITAAVGRHLEDESLFKGGILVFYDGKQPLELYDSSIRKAIDPSSSTHVTKSAVVLSASHGIYLNHKSDKWEYQRHIFNGIREDTFTPGLTYLLSNYLSQRSGLPSIFVRSKSSTIYTRSGQPFSEMAARYYIESMVPKRKDIWGSASIARPQNPEREYDDDINSRPLYANYMKASGLISVHTNGSDFPLFGQFKRGFIVIHHPDRNYDYKIAENIVCYMNELKKTDKKYENFKVRDPIASLDYGEINLSAVPTVLVETAFHSNYSDAAALKDQGFRKIAMKAVEKGWRLTQQKKDCQEFGIANIPRASGPHNTPIPVTVDYVGYPQFPVNLTVEVVKCPEGWTCRGGNLTYKNMTSSPLKYTWKCNASSSAPTATFVVRTLLTDSDNVKTEFFRNTVTCLTSKTSVDGNETPPTFGLASIN